MCFQCNETKHFHPKEGAMDGSDRNVVFYEEVGFFENFILGIHWLETNMRVGKIPRVIIMENRLPNMKSIMPYPHSIVEKRKKTLWTVLLFKWQNFFHCLFPEFDEDTIDYPLLWLV